MAHPFKLAAGMNPVVMCMLQHMVVQRETGFRPYAPAAFFSRTDAGGVLSTKVKLRSCRHEIRHMRSVFSAVRACTCFVT